MDYTIRYAGEVDDAHTVECLVGRNVVGFMVLRSVNHPELIDNDGTCKYCPFISYNQTILPAGHKHPAGEIEEIFVMPSHRGRGVAEKMYRFAVREGLNPLHSAFRTEDGVAWSEKVGGPFATYE